MSVDLGSQFMKIAIVKVKLIRICSIIHKVILTKCLFYLKSVIEVIITLFFLILAWCPNGNSTQPVSYYCLLMIFTSTIILLLYFATVFGDNKWYCM